MSAETKSFTVDKSIITHLITHQAGSIKKPQRLELCVDYMSGMGIDDICKKYKINKGNKALIYRVLKAHGLKADRRNRNKEKIA